MSSERTNPYSRLPQVGEYLAGAHAKHLLARYSRAQVLQALRIVLAGMRAAIASDSLTEADLDAATAAIPERVETLLNVSARGALQPVINATGVILQTNLGRAPLSAAAVERIAQVAQGYCNLEFNLDTGERGQRGAQVEEMLLQLLDAASAKSERRGALVVNNCAAATFLALNSLASGGEVLVSRGELVEIGGGFRIPDILRKSGAILREVGTTNRTRIEDYSEAVTPETRMILRVHRSNFAIEGFTAQPSLQELVELGEIAGIPVFEDQGTGCVVDLTDFGLNEQSSFARSVANGATLVSASGDKLLGGPQSGLLVGDAEVIGKLRGNPLYRALRVDKLTYAALHATLEAYLRGNEQSIPVLRMLSTNPETIQERCAGWVKKLAGECLAAETVPVRSVVGGGTTPGATLPSFAVALRSCDCGESELAAQLRSLTSPVVARISEGRVLLDLRTVPEECDDWLPAQIRQELGEPRVGLEDHMRDVRSRLPGAEVPR